MFTQINVGAREIRPFNDVRLYRHNRGVCLSGFDCMRFVFYTTLFCWETVRHYFPKCLCAVAHAYIAFTKITLTFSLIEYVKPLHKPVTASYSKGLFPQYVCDDGTKYNVNNYAKTTFLYSIVLV